jgi:hypothetical protein
MISVKLPDVEFITDVCGLFDEYSFNSKVYKNPSLLPILSQMNPVYTLIPYFFKIHSNYYPSKWSPVFIVDD